MSAPYECWIIEFVRSDGVVWTSVDPNHDNAYTSKSEAEAVLTKTVSTWARNHYRVTRYVEVGA